MRKALLILLFPALSWGTVITSVQTGNWGDGTTWVGGVVPKNGDKADIFHVVTATYTITIGTSPAAGTWAINLESTGAVHVTSTGHLVVRGDVIYTAGNTNTNDAVTVDGGGIFEFDSSQAVSPTSQKYAYYTSGTWGYRKFKVVGTAGNAAFLYANSSSGMGALKANGQAFTGVYELAYSSVTNMSFELFFDDSNDLPVKWDATYSTFTSCGLFNFISGMGKGATFRHEHNRHISTVGSYTFAGNYYVHKVGGTRSIQNNVFDVTLTGSGGTGLLDFTVANNFIGNGYSVITSSWSTFSNNFVRMTGTANAFGPIYNSYFWWDADVPNPHVLDNASALISSVTIAGIVFGQSGASSGDSGEFFLAGNYASASTTSITNSIFLSDGKGYSPEEITSLTTGWQFGRFVLEHNTWFGGHSNGSGAPFAALDYDETVNQSPRNVTSYRSNLLWNPRDPTRPAQFLKALDVGNIATNLAAGFGTGPTQDVCAPTNCDYNAGYVSSTTATGANISAYTNQGKGYAGKFSATPGTHDLDGANPSFVDYTRSVETFDAGYYRPAMGMGAASAWSNVGSYVIGNVVSHSTNTYHWNTSINYRYINASGCSGTNPEPGAGSLSTWEPCWEFASLEDIRSGIMSGITFTDSSIGASASDIHTTLLKWIRAGYAPTNPSYLGAAHDGTTIGAVPYTTSTRGPSDPLPGGFALSPSNNFWLTDITNAPVSSSNTLWINTINGHAGHDFHANFGSAAGGDGSWNGIPYNLVWSTVTARQAVTLTTYASESDAQPDGGIPIPADVIAENDVIGQPWPGSSGGDQHLLLIDVSSNTIYEMFGATRTTHGGTTWTAAQLTVIYSTSNVLRQAGWTSADAAGLQVTQGLLRYDEVSPTCNINHAIRMELTLTHGPYFWPARHDADSGGTLNPPFGMRVRMKPSVDLSALSTVGQCIFNAAKKYGFILADNGGDWYIDGVPNLGWDDTALHNDFITVGLPLDTMEVIDESTWMVDVNSGQEQAPAVPSTSAKTWTGGFRLTGGGTWR